MSSSKPPGPQRSVDQYLAVLEAADRTVDCLRELDAQASDRPARRWAGLRRDAGEAAQARLAVASAAGRLTDYESAVRALTGEVVPLQDAPAALERAAPRCVARLEELATSFRRTLTEAPPAIQAVSLTLRVAGCRHAARDFAAQGEITAQRPVERAAASEPPATARARWSSPDGRRTLEVQHGADLLELWVSDRDLAGPPLVPVKVEDAADSTLLFALLAERDGSRLSYLRLAFAPDRARVEIGEPMRAEQLAPTDAPSLLASMAATGRSWRRLWEQQTQGLAWLTPLLAPAPPEHERD